MGIAYKKHIPEDKIMNMKASEATKLSSEEDVLGLLGCGLFIIGFVFLISLIALFLWFNKFTIFVSAVILLTLGLTSALSYYQTMVYRKLIKEVNARLSGLESK